MNEDINRHPVITPLVGALLEPLQWPSKPVWWFAQALVDCGLALGYEPQAVCDAIAPLWRLGMLLDAPWRASWWGYLRRFEGPR
jgi:hypothetical protein